MAPNAGFCTFPPEPVPKSMDATALPDVVLDTCAAGPEVMPREKLKSAEKRPPPVSIAASRVKPNFKLWAPRSLVAFTWMLATRLMLLRSRE